MTRRLAACFILIVAGSTESAPRLKDEPAHIYFPMTVGDRWVVEMKYQTTTTEHTEVVTAVEKKDGATVTTVPPSAFSTAVTASVYSEEVVAYRISTTQRSPTVIGK